MMKRLPGVEGVRTKEISNGVSTSLVASMMGRTIDVPERQFRTRAAIADQRTDGR